MNETFETTQMQTPSPSRFRYSMRTMFVVTATVGAALALFIHYGPAPGLIFAAFVVLGSWCYLRGKSRGMAAIAALYVAVWVGLQLFGPYTSIRNRIVWVVGTERLREWADEVFASPPPVWQSNTRLLDPGTLPDDIKSIAGNADTFVVLSEDGKKGTIFFLYERWFYRWSIQIDIHGFNHTDPKFFDQIADGIRAFDWHWYRRPPNEPANVF